MKHVERRHLYVRECIERGEIVVPYVSTHDNLADFFTKHVARWAADTKILDLRARRFMQGVSPLEPTLSGGEGTGH